MSRFLIGQYGSFDYKKFQRDFREGFYGIEACLFSDERDVDNLINESRRHAFQIGIHFPLRSGCSKLRDALFLSIDNKIRIEAYSIIQQELEFLTAVKPAYILFHYPKPVILDDSVDWSLWRFADRKEYEYESSYSFNEFKEKSDALFDWLTCRGKEFNFIPVLEFDALNKYIYEEHYLQQLLEKYTNIRLCLDTARLYLQDYIDPNFDSKLFVRQYSKYAETIHLSNVQIRDNQIIQSRYPVLPSHNPNDGWAPIEEYLRIISQENKDVNIMFEHRSDFVTNEELNECYDWVEGLLHSEGQVQ